jgi:hypothetical protein
LTDLAPSPATSEKSRDELSQEAMRAAGTMDPEAYVVGFAPPHIKVPVLRQPEWLTLYGARLQELIASGVAAPDWNGHGARPLRREAVEVGLRVLGSLYQGAEGRPFPWIVPTFRGGLQFEWHEAGIDLEIDIDPNGSVDVIFSDNVQQKEWDGTLTEREWEVHSCLDRLADIGAAPVDP